MADYFKYKDLPGPARQHARKGKPDRSDQDSDYIRFEEQLGQVSSLSEATRAVASALYNWESIQVLGRHIYEVREDVYPVSLKDMSRALGLPITTIRTALTDLQRCRAI